MQKTMGAAAAGAILALLPVSAHAEPARDHTPGVVSHWEYNHARAGMTRCHVARMFGTRGHLVNQFWATHFEIVLRYESIDGRKVYATYKDPNDSGHRMVLVGTQRWA